MAEPPAGLEPVRAELARLEPLAGEAEAAVREGLQGAASAAEFARLRRELVELGAGAGAFADRLQALVRAVDRSAAEWAAARRYTDEGLAELELDLARALVDRPSTGARRWLNALFDAIRATELDAAVRIAELPLELPSELESGREQVRALARRHGAGETGAGAELMEAVAHATLPGWNRVLDSSIRSRAHRLAALFALRWSYDPEAALTALDAAVELDPLNALNYSERAAYWLFVGDFERAATDAQHAIDIAPAEPAGHLMLGLWAELTAEFEDAEELYRRALARMTDHGVAALARRGSLIDPPGLMLAVAGEHLFDVGRPQAALELADAAAAVGIRGRELRPDARVHRLRRLALEALPGRRAEAAAAAVEAGKRYVWSGASEQAVVELERAVALDGAGSEARWLLADALASISFPPGAAVGDPARIAEARAVWAAGAELGLPSGAESWAYLTRAILCDLESQHTPGDRRQGLWDAVLDCERALVHDPLDSVRWGFTARYLRSLGLDELAFEAVETGYRLNESDNAVLYQRLALLSNRGRFDDAEAVAVELVASAGEDPWVVGVQAWLALHAEHYEDALTLLDVPLSHGYDRSWYLDLRALCHLACGDLDAARDDYHAIVTGVRDGSIPITDGAVKAVLALALAIDGEVEAARSRFEDAQGEVTATDDVSEPAIDAFVSFAEDELEVAADRLRDAVGSTVTGRDLDDLFIQLPLRLRALDPSVVEACERVVRAVQAELESERRELLAKQPMATPESELARAAAEPAAAVGAAAIDARRRLLGGDPHGAVEAYERLRGTSFEPEATVALVRALHELSADGSASRDIALTRSAQQRLVELGAADPVDAALAVSSALSSAGHADEAHDELVAVANGPSSSARRELVEQSLGELELVADDPAAAAQHFDNALELAREGGDPARVAQLETRAALARLVAGSSADATRHVGAALQAWREAGAFEAPLTILQEARAILARTADSSRMRRAVELLAALVEQPAAEPDAPAEPEP